MMIAIDREVQGFPLRNEIALNDNRSEAEVVYDPVRLRFLGEVSN
jgi:hypothetical protein